MKLFMQTHTELLNIGPGEENTLVAEAPYPSDIFFNYSELDPLYDLVSAQNVQAHKRHAGIVSVNGLARTRIAANYARNNGNSLALQGNPRDLAPIYSSIVSLAGAVGWPPGLEPPEIVGEILPEDEELTRIATPLVRLFKPDRPVQVVLLKARGVNS